MTTENEKTRIRERLEALTQIKSKIQAGWTKHAIARDDKGRFSKINNPNIKHVCLEGAIQLTTKRELITDCALMLAATIEQKYPGKYKGIAHFNDHKDTTKPNIIQIINEAIEREAETL